VLELEDLIEIIDTVIDSETTLEAETVFETIPEWDSVNAMRLFTQLEKEVGKPISMKAYLKTKTIGDVFGLLTSE